MSIDQIVAEVTKLIIPVLPYIIKGAKVSGQKYVEKLGEDGAGKSMQLAEALWAKIAGKTNPSRKLSIAAEELSKTPKDKAWHSMMKQEIKLLLKANPALLKEITLLLQVEIPEQTIRAKNNVKGKIEQSNATGTGKQKIHADGNRDVVIRQNIKK